MKWYIDSLQEFSGDLLDFEDYEIATEATLGQIQHAKFLNRDPTCGDTIEEVRDKELYNMFVTSLKSVSGIHILTGITKSNFDPWKANQA